MKKILFGLTLILGAGITANAQAIAPTAATTSAPAKAAAISFVEKDNKYEFGSVPQGIPVTHVFSFKNTGKEPLVLSSVTSTCGCTVPEWPKEPLLPGSTGSIKVTYNASNIGEFTKPITVVSNASATPQLILTIHGDVKPAATATQATAPAPVKTAAAPKKS